MGDTEAGETESAAIRRVVGRVADDLSGPLTNLLSRLDLMLMEVEDRPLRPSQIDDLRSLRRNALRMVHLVQVLRYRAGNGTPGWQLLPLNEIVSRALSAGQVGARVALDPGHPAVVGNPDALEGLVADLLIVASLNVAAGNQLQVQTRAASGVPPRAVIAISGLAAAPELSERQQGILAEHGGAIEFHSSPPTHTLVLSLPDPSWCGAPDPR